MAPALYEYYGEASRLIEHWDGMIGRILDGPPRFPAPSIYIFFFSLDIQTNTNLGFSVKGLFCIYD